MVWGLIWRKNLIDYRLFPLENHWTYSETALDRLEPPLSNGMNHRGLNSFVLREKVIWNVSLFFMIGCVWIKIRWFFERVFHFIINFGSNPFYINGNLKNELWKFRGVLEHFREWVSFVLCYLKRFRVSLIGCKHS